MLDRVAVSYVGRFAELLLAVDLESQWLVVDDLIWRRTALSQVRSNAAVAAGE